MLLIQGGTIHPPDKSGGILYPSTPRYKTYRQTIEAGIISELEAIAYYNYLISIETNGNTKRSWIHVRNEEKDHLMILKNKLKRMG